MLGSLAVASVCGAAVFFMLVFLSALLKETAKSRFQVTGKREKINAVPVSIQDRSRRLDRAA
jgi:hypothetical protein